MNFSELCSLRQSHHYFLPDQKLPAETFYQILEDVRQTPSGYNAQPWRFVLIQDDETLKEVSDLAFGQKHIVQAGNVIVVVGDTEFGVNETERILNEWKTLRDFSDEKIQAMKDSLIKDRPLSQKREMTIRACSIAAMTLLYSAESYGWQTCPMMGFSQRRLKALLNMSESEIPTLLIALGKQDPQVSVEPMIRKSGKTIGEIWTPDKIKV